MAITQRSLKSELPPKDYSQFVDFPVEIVGKDGVIREYTFEQSINLYQQRIRSARLKFHRQDSLQHEIEHCTKRIAQLRRSFFARYAWEAFQCVGTVDGQITPIIAGELAAYLRRRFGAGVIRPPVKISELVDLPFTETNQLSFGLDLGHKDQIFLLHVFCNAENYHWYINSIQTGPNSQHKEFICDMHSLNDMFFVLVSDKNPPDDLFLNTQSHDSPQRNGLLKRGYECLLKGNTVDALDIFITAYEEHPHTRGAYWGAAIVADQLRAYAESEFALRLGCHHFPHDAGLQLRLAAAYVRRGAKKANAQLHIARRLNGENPLVKLLLIVHGIQNGSLRSPISRLVELDDTLKKYPGVRRTQRWLVQSLLNRLVNSSILLGLTFLCGIVYWSQTSLLHANWSLILVLICLTGFVAYRVMWSHHFKKRLLAHHGRQIHLLPSSDLSEILGSFLDSQ